MWFGDCVRLLTCTISWQRCPIEAPLHSGSCWRLEGLRFIPARLLMTTTMMIYCQGRTRNARHIRRVWLIFIFIIINSSCTRLPGILFAHVLISGWTRYYYCGTHILMCLLWINNNNKPVAGNCGMHNKLTMTGHGRSSHWFSLWSSRSGAGTPDATHT